MTEPEKKDKDQFQKKTMGPAGFYLIFFIFLAAMLLILISGIGDNRTWLSDQEAYRMLESGKVKNVVVETTKLGDASGHAVLDTGEKEKLYFFVSDVSEFRQNLLEKYPDVPLYSEPLEKEGFFASMMPYLLVMIIGIVVLVLILGRMGGNANAQAMNFGKSRARLYGKKDLKINFQSVAGCKEEKEELMEVVEYLKDPRRFNAMGARIPKGVLLVGSPGTGKTFLARAVAGEAGVPFFSISGSDFVEMFVGVGASRVRDLFENAKRYSPSIVFIDEIDAVGRRRGAGLGGGHDEREQTLNQLLVEMDGFAPNDSVIVMAATNRVDILDPALLRPGRFDRQIVVSRPDVDAREEVLKLYAKNKPIGSDVDLSAIARLTIGFTPADLENLLNEAAILAGRDRSAYISNAHIQSAMVRVSVGTEKKSRRITDKDKKMTAYHEIGHAIIHLALPELDAVHMVSIIPTGMAGGYTMSFPKEDRMYVSRNELKAEMASFLGGRVAEQLIFNDITSGASNDLEHVSSIAREMVTKYGMSEELGPVQFGEHEDEVFLGKEIGHTRNYGDRIADQIDVEVKKLIDEAEKLTVCVLTEYMDLLHEGAALLMQREKISGEELEEMFRQKRAHEDE